MNGSQLAKCNYRIQKKRQQQQQQQLNIDVIFGYEIAIFFIDITQKKLNECIFDIVISIRVKCVLFVKLFISG